MSIIPATWEEEIGGSWFKASLGPNQAKPNTVRAGVAEVVQHLPSKHKVLSQTPVSQKSCYNTEKNYINRSIMYYIWANSGIENFSEHLNTKGYY
jgi:hypothetical protein